VWTGLGGAPCTDPANWLFNATRIELYGDKNLMIMGRHGGGWQAFGPDGKVVAQGPGRRPSDDHFENFFQCLRSRKRPNADVEIGHRSISVCHLANIARQVGRRLCWDPETETFPGDQEANAYLDRPRRKGWELPRLA